MKDTTIEALPVSRGPYRLYAEMAPADGTPVVLMHGFPDNTHLYDRLVPHLIGRRPVVRFDFLGWGRSDKPAGYPYTTNNQGGDLTAVVTALDERFGTTELILVAHDASGPPAIDWALAHSRRVAALVLLNTYYHWTPSLRRPPAIALYSTPIVRTVARALVRRRPDLDRRLYEWQVGGFIRDPEVRMALVPQLYAQFLPSRPAFWRLNDDLLATVLSRRRRIPELRRFNPPVRIIFGAHDRSLNPRVARNLAALFPHSELHLLDDAGHFVQVDQPRQVADLIVGTQAGASGRERGEGHPLSRCYRCGTIHGLDRMDAHRAYRHFCMIARALEVVGERWSLLIARDLTLGPQRFTDLARGLAGITPTRLTHRLRQLEAAGVVTRTPAAAGREVWYELTEAGHDLGPILEALTLWGIEHAPERPRAGERVPPIPTMIGTKMWLSRNAMPQRPVTWVWQFAGEGDYTIDFDHAVWTLSRGAAKVADVTVDATPDAWARLLTTPRGSRRLSEKSIRLAGTQDSIDLFAQSFILELGRRRPARPAGTLHRAT